MGVNDRDYIRKEGPSFLGSFVERGTVCKWLIGVNVVVFILQLLTTTRDGQPVTSALDLNVFEVLHGQVWRLLTYAFLHDPDNIWHIVFNMLLLWWFGRDMEDLYGPREFLAFYLSAAFLGGVAFCAAYPLGLNGGPGGYLALGASGAVTAVLVLCAIHFPRRIIYLMFLLPVPIWLFVVGSVALDLYTMLSRQNTGIAVSIHCGGAAFAFLYHRFHWRIDGLLKRLWPNVRSWRRRATGPRLRVYREEPPAREPVRATAAVAPGADEDRIKAEMDAVLEKISRVGRENLTPDDLEVLQRASEILRGGAPEFGEKSMPLYEYTCRKCDHTFEALVFGPDFETTCPKCESAKVEKQLSAPARPQTEAASLPMGCDPSLPPCGAAGCRRLNG